MDAAPNNEQAADDPWRVSAQLSTAHTPGRGPRMHSPQQAARLRRIQVAQAKRAASTTWPMVFRWTFATAAFRILAACVMILFGMQNAHMHSLLLSSATTADEWNAAVHTESLMNGLDLLVLAALAVPGPAWLRTRAYLVKLPGVAPHPLQKTNATYRAMNMPAYWPPVPTGTESWTSRIHWRVPGGITALYAVLLLGGGIFASRILQSLPTRHEFLSVDEIAVAVLMLAAAALDFARLREYSRWPGRPQQSALGS